jgi:C_GCAxxG_C_C family probable redox protein
MLVETVLKYYDKKYDLNCAECMLVAANEEYDLNIPKVAMKSMAAFGGGMGIGSVCGAATGAISVIGMMFAEDRGHASPQVKEMTVLFMDEFNKQLKSLECVPLKEMYFKDDGNRCLEMMKVAAVTLDKIITDNESKYKIYR